MKLETIKLDFSGKIKSTGRSEELTYSPLADSRAGGAGKIYIDGIIEL